MKILVLVSGLCLSLYASVEKGKYIFDAASCISCHAPTFVSSPYGGREIKTSFGSFFGPNITPDKKTGIGNWSRADFFKAMRKGKSPSGKPYYPSFPFSSYTKLTKEDINHLYDYLMSLEPVEKPSKRHQLKGLYKSRVLLYPWRWANFRKKPYKKKLKSFKYRGEYVPHLDKSKKWNRGAYLAEAMFHCTECHTPRNAIGGLKKRKWFTGEYYFGEKRRAGNITRKGSISLAGWTYDNWDIFFQYGELPDESEVSGEMYAITKKTANLTDEDREALIEYMLSL